MENTAIALVAIGAVFAALYNTFTKKVQTDHWKTRSSLLVTLHQGTASLLLFVVTSFTGGPQIQNGFFWPMMATGVLNIGIILGKMRARALEEVSLVTPIDSTTPAVVIVTSMVILNEYPSTLGWVGIWVMALGTYTLNIQDVKTQLAKRVEQGISPWRRFASIWLAPFLALGKSQGVRWAFFSVALSTLSLNFDGLVARRSNIAFGLACILGITALGNLAIALVRKEHQGAQLRGATFTIIPLALFYAAGNFITNFAYRLDIVPYVGTMKRLQIPLTIVLAYFIVGEKKSFKERMVGGVLMAVGATLIALASK